ncbi:MAG: hypothetical protein H6719_19480 [Sandaracinaceae bacterium]|nr:hypothetical protein [Sandaracinaceae bacterium]
MDRALKGAAVLALALSVLISPARGALPPRHGGVLTLPAPEPLGPLDPARVETSFEATLADAVFDNLYEVRPDGTVEAVLAAGPPTVEGTTARVTLRPGARLHGGGRDLQARHVVRSLLRTTSSAQASWLLGAFASESGRPAIREVDAHTIELELARRGVRVDLILAATPLAIVGGGDLRRRPLGTGPFSARLDGHGGAELSIFRHAPEGAPWIDRVVFTAARPRDDEIRAYELGRLDGSWQGRSLYGREPSRPARTTEATVGTPWILVPNRARVLHDDETWGGVVASIDRNRLARVGLVPRRTLNAGLPAPRLPTAAPRAGTRLTMPVREDRPRELRAAEAIAGMLDERGIVLTVERLSAERYERAIARSQWDLRIARVRPPLPGRGPMAGAALAAAGQTDQARALVPTLGEPEVANQTAEALDAMVLGHEHIVLHHRADLRRLSIDVLGRLSLAELAFARTEEPFR